MIQLHKLSMKKKIVIMIIILLPLFMFIFIDMVQTTNEGKKSWIRCPDGTIQAINETTETVCDRYYVNYDADKNKFTIITIEQHEADEWMQQTIKENIEELMDLPD